MCIYLRNWLCIVWSYAIHLHSRLSLFSPTSSCVVHYCITLSHVHCVMLRQSLGLPLWVPGVRDTRCYSSALTGRDNFHPLLPCISWGVQAPLQWQSAMRAIIGVSLFPVQVGRGCWAGHPGKRSTSTCVSYEAWQGVPLPPLTGFQRCSHPPPLAGTGERAAPSSRPGIRADRFQLRPPKLTPDVHPKYGVCV